MTSSCSRKTKSGIRHCAWWIMAFTATISMFTMGSFPIVKSMMIRYPIPDTNCVGGMCDDGPICVINGTILGGDFQNVDNYYTFPICTFAVIVNFFLIMRIVGSRFVNMFMTTFAFFCLIVFPIRFTFLAMQTLEFTAVGGDYYTLLLWDPTSYDCPLHSEYIDAVFLMHCRLILLLVDFFTFHALILCVPFYFVDDKINAHKYSSIHDEKMGIFAHPASMVIFQDV
ncbi:hypothetical protein CAEBREN_21134 [Caenorhabditis brenneri]|uniref:Uncharacterized protein n=1 Tax=Caenorhabditis brenneri TaxID=135651 RepID=G0NKY8_CAEBE|nr:hypothetical protein CAEBREN_21134 [Caenorhabditis brenneri]